MNMDVIELKRINSKMSNSLSSVVVPSESIKTTSKRKSNKETYCEFDIMEKYEKYKREQRHKRRNNLKQIDMMNKIKCIKSRNNEIELLYKKSSNVQVVSEICSDSLKSKTGAEIILDISDVPISQIIKKHKHRSHSHKINNELISKEQQSENELKREVKRHRSHSSPKLSRKDKHRSKHIEVDKTEQRIVTTSLIDSKSSHHCTESVNEKSKGHKKSHKKREIQSENSNISSKTIDTVISSKNISVRNEENDKSRKKREKYGSKDQQINVDVKVSKYPTEIPTKLCEPTKLSQCRKKSSERYPSIQVQIIKAPDVKNVHIERIEKKSYKNNLECKEYDVRKEAKQKHEIATETSKSLLQDIKKIYKEQIKSSNAPDYKFISYTVSDILQPTLDELPKDSLIERNITKQHDKPKVPPSTQKMLTEEQSVKIHRKELSFSNLILTPQQMLYTNSAKYATTQTSQLLEPESVKIVHDTSTQKNCFNNVTPYKLSKTSIALRDIYQVTQLEKLKSHNVDNNSICSDIITKRELMKARNTLEKSHDKFIENKKFHTSKTVVPNNRIIQVASKILNNEKISFTVEAVEPIKRIQIGPNTSPRSNIKNDKLSIQVLPGLSVNFGESTNEEKKGDSSKDSEIIQLISYDKENSASLILDESTSKSLIQEENNLVVTPVISQTLQQIVSKSFPKYVCRKNISKRRFNKKSEKSLTNTADKKPMYTDSSTQTVNLMMNKVTEVQTIFCCDEEVATPLKKDIPIVTKSHSSASFVRTIHSADNLKSTNDLDEERYYRYVVHTLRCDNFKRRGPYNTARKSKSSNSIRSSKSNRLCLCPKCRAEYRDSDSKKKYYDGTLKKQPSCLKIIKSKKSVTMRDYPNAKKQKPSCCRINCCNRKKNPKCSTTQGTCTNLDSCAAMKDCNMVKKTISFNKTLLKDHQKEIRALEKCLNDILAKLYKESKSSLGIAMKLNKKACKTCPAGGPSKKSITKLQRSKDYSENVRKRSKFCSKRRTSVPKQQRCKGCDAPKAVCNVLLDNTLPDFQVKKVYQNKGFNSSATSLSSKMSECSSVSKSPVFKVGSSNLSHKQAIKHGITKYRMKNNSYNMQKIFKREKSSLIKLFTTSTTSGFGCQQTKKKSNRKKHLVIDNLVIQDCYIPTNFPNYGDGRGFRKEPFYISEKQTTCSRTSVDSLDLLPYDNEDICPLTAVFNFNPPTFAYYVYNAEVQTTFKQNGNKNTKKNESQIKTKLEEVEPIAHCSHDINFNHNSRETSKTYTTFQAVNECNDVVKEYTSFAQMPKTVTWPENMCQIEKPTGKTYTTFADLAKTDNLIKTNFIESLQEDTKSENQLSSINETTNTQNYITFLSNSNNNAIIFNNVPSSRPLQSPERPESQYSFTDKKKLTTFDKVKTNASDVDSKNSNLFIQYINKKTSERELSNMNLIRSNETLQNNSTENESGYESCKTLKSKSIKSFFKKGGSFFDLLKSYKQKKQPKKKCDECVGVNHSLPPVIREIKIPEFEDSKTKLNLANFAGSKTIMWYNLGKCKKEYANAECSTRTHKFGKKTNCEKTCKLKCQKSKATSTSKTNSKHKCGCSDSSKSKECQCNKYVDKDFSLSKLTPQISKVSEEVEESSSSSSKKTPPSVISAPVSHTSDALTMDMDESETDLEERVSDASIPLVHSKTKRHVEARDLEERISDASIPLVHSKTKRHVEARDSTAISFANKSDKSDTSVINLKRTDGKKVRASISASTMDPDRRSLAESTHSQTSKHDSEDDEDEDSEKKHSTSSSKMNDKEVFDKLLKKHDLTDTIAKRISNDDTFFAEQISEIGAVKKKKTITLEPKDKDKDSLTDKIRGPRFMEKLIKQTNKECDVEVDDIGTCFARGFRPDNLMLSGDACFNLNKQDRIKMSPQMLKNVESIIDFSERETPLDFLLALGFMVDEASNALKDDDIRSRLLAAITEARVWINKITTTQGTLLYLVAYKARPDTMRYFLQLVEAIINKRINNAIKLHGFLRILEQVETGRLQMINILGEDKFDDEENEEKVVKKQLKELFATVYATAEREAEEKGVTLHANQIMLLRILVAKYRAGLHPHLELIARYIGQGLLDSDIQLEAAMIFLSRLDTADVKLKEFENYCGITCALENQKNRD